VETDHEALVHLKKSTKYMILDWLSFILEFDFYVVYKKGTENILLDRLSRIYDEGKEEEHSNEVIFNVQDMDVNEIKSGAVGKITQELMKNLTRKKEPPETEKEELIKAKHKESHFRGTGLFLQMFQEGFYWKQKRESCRKVAAGCQECLKYNVRRVGFHPVGPVLAQLPFDQIAMDLLEPLPTTGNGHNMVLLIVDISTRFIILKVLQTKKMEEIAATLLEVFVNFGVPKIIQSDNDPSFLNSVMDALRETVGFWSRAVLKYFLAQNGVAKRFVGKKKQLLLKILQGDLNHWDLMIPVVQMSLNDCIIQCHHSTPFAVMFGRKLNSFQDYSEVQGTLVSLEDLIKRNKKMVEVICPALFEKSEKAGNKQAKQLNKKIMKNHQVVPPLPIRTTVMKKVTNRGKKT
jgi:hypothetical protein